MYAKSIVSNKGITNDAAVAVEHTGQQAHKYWGAKSLNLFMGGRRISISGSFGTTGYYVCERRVFQQKSTRIDWPHCGRQNRAKKAPLHSSWLASTELPANPRAQCLLLRAASWNSPDSTPEPLLPELTETPASVPADFLWTFRRLVHVEAGLRSEGRAVPGAFAAERSGGEESISPTVLAVMSSGLSQSKTVQAPAQVADMTRVYLDYNATTPVEPAVVQALLPFLGPQFGNASSSYALGQAAKQAVAGAREQVASLLGAAHAAEVVFLSGGTESINYAIKGAALAARRDSARNHIVTSCVEHVAVLETCKWLETQGFQVTYLPVDRFGCVRVQDLLDALTPQTCVVSIMLANNEVGSLQPVADISRAVRRFVDEQERHLPIVVHTDASQAIGKVRVNVQDLGVDLLTVAGHKLYAPKGVGALYIREGTVVDTIIHGASQENGRRGGTENVALVVALGQACELVEKNLHDAGSACHSHQHDGNEKQMNPEHQEENITISHVLAAMHVAPEFAKGTLRLSVGRANTQEELLYAANAIHKAIQQLM
ncbi:unnamed protein product [Phytophthora fragariaefolia]|uniref:cysteine desulfurase n=1 Tax=Phytophthora fragariaefolia TaxID=1490495 RepID=A0A9W7D1V5_9STRA|nr:unnamed protein product [Phytophthora fragariaefolia]